MASEGPRPLVAGNWKMNGSVAMLKEPRLLAAMLKDVKLKADVMVCPPAILVRRVKSVLKGSKIRVGGQDCHWNASGAHTGDISADMLKEAGCTAVIVGHSERRTNHGETDEMVSKKARAVQKAGGTTTMADFIKLYDNWTADGALEMKVLKADETTFDFDITRCRYAETYKEMGLGKIGHLLSCNRDGTFCEGYDPNITLERKQTIMEGASCCTFRYSYKAT